MGFDVGGVVIDNINFFLFEWNLNFYFEEWEGVYFIDKGIKILGKGNGLSKGKEVGNERRL